MGLASARFQARADCRREAGRLDQVDSLIRSIPKTSNWAAASKRPVARGRLPGRRKPIALRCPASRKPRVAVLATRSTHASHPWKLRANLCVLLRSCSGQKARGLPIPGKPRSSHATSRWFAHPGKRPLVRRAPETTFAGVRDFGRTGTLRLDPLSHCHLSSVRATGRCIRVVTASAQRADISKGSDTSESTQYPN